MIHVSRALEVGTLCAALMLFLSWGMLPTGRRILISALATLGFECGFICMQSETSPLGWLTGIIYTAIFATPAIWFAFRPHWVAAALVVLLQFASLVLLIATTYSLRPGFDVDARIIMSVIVKLAILLPFVAMLIRSQNKAAPVVDLEKIFE